jgi:hypothetical protein
MAITAPKMNSNSNFELTPAGNHIARLYKIVNLGTIDSGFQNEDGSPKLQPKIRLYFELPKKLLTYTDKEGKEVTKPFSISKEVTLSMFKGKQVAKLRDIVESVLGVTLKDEEADVFDVEDLLGRACMVQVAHETGKDGAVYAKIATISSLPEGIEAPEAVNPKEVVDVNTSSQEEIGKLSEYLRVKIESSVEYKERFGSQEI